MSELTPRIYLIVGEAISLICRFDVMYTGIWHKLFAFSISCTASIILFQLAHYFVFFVIFKTILLCVI
jgi:hypothetical protein